MKAYRDWKDRWKERAEKKFKVLQVDKIMQKSIQMGKGKEEGKVKARWDNLIKKGDTYTNTNIYKTLFLKPLYH